MKGMEQMFARMLPDLLPKILKPEQIAKVMELADRLQTWDARLSAIEQSLARLEKHFAGSIDDGK